MYIIETFRGIVKIDEDEVVKLRDEIDSHLIFFRQGAVNPKQIVRVVRDEDREHDVPKMVNETEEDYQIRLASERSEDIFAHIRKHDLPTLNSVPNLRLKS